MKTLEQVFDTAAIGLLKQGRRSLFNNQVCAYRGGEGCKCAVGFLIADEHYATDLEGKNVSRAVVTTALYASGVDTLDFKTRELLTDLQIVHDVYPPTEWARQLMVLRQKFSVKPNPAFLDAMKENEDALLHTKTTADAVAND